MELVWEQGAEGGWPTEPWDNFNKIGKITRLKFFRCVFDRSFAKLRRHRYGRVTWCLLDANLDFGSDPVDTIRVIASSYAHTLY